MLTVKLIFSPPYKSPLIAGHQAGCGKIDSHNEVRLLDALTVVFSLRPAEVR
ncbi:hypothetical protein ACSUZJ_22400 [Telluria sp. B2]